MPYSRFLRLRRVCNDHTFKRRSDEMSEFFSQIVFPIDAIRNNFRKASMFSHSEAISRRKNMNNTGIFLTMKFSGITQLFAKTVKNNLRILSANHKTNRIFSTISIFAAFKRDKNLRDYFIRSKLNLDNNTVKTPGTPSCLRPRCNTCSHETLGNTIRGSSKIWNEKGSYICISSNVICVITCTRC